MKPAELDPAISRSDYALLRARPELWLPALERIARAHALAGDVRPAPAGSNLVAFAGAAHVVKAFPPFLRDQYESERRMLALLESRAGVATPALVAAGELEGWPYVVMTRVEGEPLADAWPAADEAQRCALLEEIGALVARIQTLSPAPLEGLAPPWPEFLARQVEGCVARHARLGLPAHLLADLPRYLAATRDVLPVDVRAVILTGEYTPGNVLVRRDGRTWRVCGLIDFGDARTGFAEYDLLGPATFLAAGEPERLLRLARGFGYGASASGRALGRRLMRMLLLHRHADFDVQLGIDGWKSRARDLDGLERLVFPFPGGAA